MHWYTDMPRMHLSIIVFSIAMLMLMFCGLHPFITGGILCFGYWRILKRHGQWY